MNGRSYKAPPESRPTATAFSCCHLAADAAFLEADVQLSRSSCKPAALIVRISCFGGGAILGGLATAMTPTLAAVAGSNRRDLVAKAVHERSADGKLALLFWRQGARDGP